MSKGVALKQTAEACISQGMLYSQCVRTVAKRHDCSDAVARRAVDAAFATLGIDARVDPRERIEAMIAVDRNRAIQAGDRSEAGKCVDRMLKLYNAVDDMSDAAEDENEFMKWLERQQVEG